MTIKSGIFNSVNKDRRYLAADYASYFASFIANGVFPNPSDGFQVIANDDMTVTLKAGKAWIHGYYCFNDSDYVLELDVADGVLKRIDRIALRLDYAKREMVPVVKKGVFASSPVAPTLQRDSDAYEIALADVFIGNGVLSITQANITDQRLNSALCGIVASTVDQIDTSTVFNQYYEWFLQTKDSNVADLEEFKQQQESDFNAWFETVKGKLAGDIATNLANDIMALEGEVFEDKIIPTPLVQGSQVINAVRKTPYQLVRAEGKTDVIEGKGIFGIKGLAITNETNGTYKYHDVTLHEGDVLEGDKVTRARREVVLDGSETWGFRTDYAGFKRVATTSRNLSNLLDIVAISKYDGKILVNNRSDIVDAILTNKELNEIHITIADIDSGWGESYSPTADEVKAYFLGYKMRDNLSASNTFNGTNAKGWIAIEDYRKGSPYPNMITTLPTTQAPMNNLWQPYKLVYELATPVMETIRTEGEVILEEGDNNVTLGQGYDFETGEFVAPEITATIDSVQGEVYGSIKSLVDKHTGQIGELMGEFDELPSLYAKKVQEGWIDAALQNGWVNSNENDIAGYHKDEFGKVFLRGRIGGGIINTAAFVLPLGYRPEKGHYVFPIASNDGANFVHGTVYVYDTGDVLIRSGGTFWTSISGIVFKAEQ